MLERALARDSALVIKLVKTKNVGFEPGLLWKLVSPTTDPRLTNVCAVPVLVL
jgi:hypothetical protein